MSSSEMRFIDESFPILKWSITSDDDLLYLYNAMWDTNRMIIDKIDNNIQNISGANEKHKLKYSY